MKELLYEKNISNQEGCPQHKLHFIEMEPTIGVKVF